MRRVGSGSWTPAKSRSPSLPADFMEIKSVLDEEGSVGNMVNVVGLIKDCRLPMPTRKTDYKCTLTFYDISTQEEGKSIDLVIFRPEAEMPQVAARDVVMIFNAKVQRYRTEISLISNWHTLIYVYTAEKIPKPPTSAQRALLPDPKEKGSGPLGNDHHCYVSHFYHTIDKEHAPDVEEFNERASMSMNFREKFSLLKDVEEHKIYDLIVHVVRQPWDTTLGTVTLYVSDYTKNEGFFNHTPEAVEDFVHPYDDTSTSPGVSKKGWVGPYGKQALQITCWGPHASFIMSDVAIGQWVFLRNVQIKCGRDGQNLEGFLREDRGAFADKVNVDVLEISNSEAMDPRFKDALRRWRDYTKQNRKDKKELKGIGSTDSDKKGAKRKAGDSPAEQPKTKLSSREQRKLKRAALEKEYEQRRLEKEKQLCLNDLVKCEDHAHPLSTIESILEPLYYETTIDSEEVSLPIPFSCTKYRAQVRVVDFFPRKLEDFARSRKSSVLDDILSDDGNGDDSSSSSSSSDSDDESGGADDGHELVWEWRFALRLEDGAAPKKGGPKHRVWVLVDNPDGQCLTGLNACNLFEDQETLASLRERLFTLWGNLEEHKASKAPKELPSAGAKGSRKREFVQLEKPALDSSDGEDNADKGDKGTAKEEGLSNKPFTCCIKQYGVRIKDGQSLPGANEDENVGFKRVFGLFGTMISVR
ncbi:hypothetical protein B0H66DRAFT_637089 [Apodospora peruviana]|uniref:Protection of telomeres protein 1 n=1 Tax=Apodospora peruviana TaxID=516989 RepID=A0AAE0IJ35_9PEZI|nr:hypothetical protein B0H66DRAFT_637089 [Apodospora peruviana]